MCCGNMLKQRQYTEQTKAPFDMCCSICSAYIYCGKLYMAHKEHVDDEIYQGAHFHRYYIQCSRCQHEISFQSVPYDSNQGLEGATRIFMEQQTAERQAYLAEQKSRDVQENFQLDRRTFEIEQSRTLIKMNHLLELLRIKFSDATESPDSPDVSVVQDDSPDSPDSSDSPDSPDSPTSPDSADLRNSPDSSNFQYFQYSSDSSDTQDLSDLE